MKHLVSFLLIVVCLLAAISTCPAGQWVRVSIHNHCLPWSVDAGKSPQDAVAAIRAVVGGLPPDGKCCIIFTQHFDGMSATEGAYESYISVTRGLSDKNCIVIACLEVGSFWHPEPNTVADANILAVGLLPADYANLRKFYAVNTTGKGLPLVEKFGMQQKLIEQILAMGMLPIAAHSTQLVIGGDLHRIDNRFDWNNCAGLRGIEMYNVLGPGQEKDVERHYLDHLAAGQPLLVTAGADSHGTTASAIPDAVLNPLERITWIYADDFSEASILRAIGEGKTYAANGGAFFTDFLRDYGQNPGLAAVGVDQMTITAQCWLTGTNVKLVVYRDGVEVTKQEYKGSLKRSYYVLNGGDDFQTGWTDTGVTPGSVHTYVIGVQATTKFGEQTLLITSPITLRLRQPGQTASFFDAIKAGNSAAVLSALTTDRSFANARDLRNYDLPVHSAKPLALSVACAQGNTETVRLLLESGADPDCRLTAGEPGPLMEVAYNGDTTKAALLLSHGADINIRTNSNSPLIWAIGEGHNELAKLLIERGADVNLPSEGQQRPLAIARRNNLTEIVNLLLARGAKE